MEMLQGYDDMKCQGKITDNSQKATRLRNKKNDAEKAKKSKVQNSR